jgi:hypothetical protein
VRTSNCSPLTTSTGVPGFKLALPRCTYELDQPAVLSFKHEVLDEQGAIASGIRTAVAADLRVDWPKTSRSGGGQSVAHRALSRPLAMTGAYFRRDLGWGR